MNKQVLLLLLTFCAGAVRAQIPGEPATVQSPNASSLGLYGEVPVSLYTGLPSIDIPLYTVQEGQITVPITLSYHASGFRPDMHPGWVGMGWNLSAGGTINRSVKDLPDEYDNARYTSGGQAGYYFNGTVLNRSDWYTTSTLESIAQHDAAYKDTEPDEFSFSAYGYSGKFYLKADGTWKVKCNKPITVTPTVPSQISPFQDTPFPSINGFGASKTFVGFTITTEDGTRLIFGGPTSAIEYEIGMFSQNKEEWVANSWYLTQIVHTDGHQVSLNYERDAGEYVAQMYINLQDNLSTRTVSSNGTLNPTATCSSNSQSNSVDNSYSGKLIAPVYLAAIQTSESTIYFDRVTSTELRYSKSLFDYKYGMSTYTYPFPFLQPNILATYPECLDNLKWKKLNGIRIVSKLPVQYVKSFSFKYNDNPNERLTLLKVTEYGTGGTAKQPFRFGYNKPHGLEGYLANKNDHWGFYNARLANPDYNAYYSYREPNPDSAVYLAGMLTKMVYPTGGVTNFLYEQHAYGKQLDVYRFTAPQPTTGNQVAGGVRIRKITSYSLDKPQQKLEKEYLYVTGYSPSATGTLVSSGILGGRVQYLFDDFRAQSFNDNVTYSRSIFSTQSVLPACTNSQGSHIGYSTVVEKRSDGGYTQYGYSNFDTGNLDEFPINVLQATVQKSRTLYSPYSATDEERGKLLQEDLYNSAGQRVKQRTIAYTALNKSTEFVPAMQAFNQNVCSNTAVSIDQGATYKIYTYPYLPTQETETVYDKNGQNGVVTTKTYAYDDNTHRLVKSELLTDSKGGSLETRYRYPLDFPYSGAIPTDAVARGLVLMQGAKNMVGYPIETTQWRNSKIVNATVALYAEFSPGQVLARQVLQLNPVQPLTVGQYSGPSFTNQTASAQFVTDPNMTSSTRFTDYDSQGNLLGLEQRGAPATSFLWGYNRTHPIAKTVNAQKNETFHSNFEEGTGWQTDASAFNTFAYDTQLSHTGTAAGVMTCSNPQDMNHSFSTTPLTIALTATKRFVLSGWVYSEGPSAQLWLFMYQPGQTGYTYTQVDYTAINPSILGSTNKWVYLEKEIDVPANIVTLNCRLTAYYNGVSTGGGRVWFDDVRIHPADAQMTTYTHAPGIGVTSMSDKNSRPTYYEYDELNRLSLLRDHNRDVLKQFQYHYRIQ